MSTSTFSSILKDTATDLALLSATHEEETPAQAEARANASKKIEMERLSRLWNWAREALGMNAGSAE